MLRAFKCDEMRAYANIPNLMGKCVHANTHTWDRKRRKNDEAEDDDEDEAEEISRRRS